MIKNAQDVLKTMTRKNEMRRECFDKIVDMCVKKIVRGAALNMTQCFFEVPEFVLGFPLYDINECILYVIKGLQGAGYVVKYFFPRVIHVSWASSEVESRKFASQISALLDKPVNVPMLTCDSPQPASVPQKKTKGKGKKTKVVRPIAEYKPSGKFVLNI